MQVTNWLRNFFIRKGPEPYIPITRAVAIFNLSDEFVQSGTQLNIPINGISSVRYFLYCHGIELALKAFLVSQGTTDKKLRRIGHDLIVAFKAARRYESFKLLFDDKDRNLLAWLNSYYKDKEFEYLFVGLKSYPIPEAVHELAERFLVNLKPIIWESAHSYIEQSKNAQQ